MFTIRELKQNLGPGLGLRKNRYMIEIPVPGIDGKTLNILCQSAGLPERDITVTTVWHQGRQYNVRGETNYKGEYEINIVDDSDMQIRKLFDTWLKQVDNSKPKVEGILGNALKDAGMGGLVGNIKSAVKIANDVKNLVKNPKQIMNWFINTLSGTNSGSMPRYQTDINIWQLGPGNEKVYGYTLQNAFPKNIGIVTLEDSNENMLSQFSVMFAFSEFEPITGIKSNLKTTLLGEDVVETIGGVEALFH